MAAGNCPAELNRPDAMSEVRTPRPDTSSRPCSIYPAPDAGAGAETPLKPRPQHWQVATVNKYRRSDLAGRRMFAPGHTCRGTPFLLVTHGQLISNHTTRNRSPPFPATPPSPEGAAPMVSP